MLGPEVVMNTMLHIFALACLLGGLALAAAAQTESSSVFEPFIFSADFESGSVGAWSSYPPAQDTAYDPSIWVKKIDGGAGLRLVREISPYSPITYTFGVRKKVDIYLNRDSRLSFRYYVKSYTGVRQLIVRLGFSDGSASDISVSVPAALAWNVAQPGVTAAIAGSRNPAHVRANSAAGDVDLDDATLAAISATLG